VEYYDDEKDIELVFLTNNFEVSALEIAHLYRNRWQIEVFFYAKKKIMQSGIINGANNQLVNLFTLQYRFA
jgi:IS4 transposase